MKLLQAEKGVLVRRYKRFLADVILSNDKLVTVHCPNPGTMETCWQQGDDVIVTLRSNLKRKLPYTLEMIKHQGQWIGVNTQNANKLVEEALKKNILKKLVGVTNWQAEKKYGKSRIDFFGKERGKEVWLEVKSATYSNSKFCEFPDSKTQRGQKHLQELMKIAKEGNRAILIFAIQRQGCDRFKIANKIDPVYNELFNQASQEGVEILPYETFLNEEEIYLTGKILKQ